MPISTTPTSNYSQIPFEFADAEKADQQAEIDGVRIKSIKKKEPARAEAIITPPRSTRGRKSLKDTGTVEVPDVPPDELLFQKQYYSMGEVATMFQVNHSLLRFWESEFDILQPRKNKKGDRHFRPIDIQNLQLIYDLLRRRKLTIEGAKNFIKQHNNSKQRFVMIRSLQQIKSFILEIRASL